MHLGQGVWMSLTTPSSNSSGPITSRSSALACSPACTSTWLISIGGSRSGVRGTRPTPRRRARVASRTARPNALWPKVCSVVRRIAARSMPSKPSSSASLGRGPGTSPRSARRRSSPRAAGRSTPWVSRTRLAPLAPSRSTPAPGARGRGSGGRTPRPPLGPGPEPGWRGRCPGPPLLPPKAEASAGVLVVHGLFGDAEAGRDLLPGPALGPSVLHLQGLQDLNQAPQGGHRGQPDLGVLAAGRRRHLGHLAGGRLTHEVNLH